MYLQLGLSGLEQTHIQYPDRLARLILVMSLALYWAVSTGMWDQANNPIPAEKKTRLSAYQARTRKALLVHARPPPRHKTPPRMPPSPETLGVPIKLMDAQPGHSQIVIRCVYKSPFAA